MYGLVLVGVIIDYFILSYQLHIQSHHHQWLYLSFQRVIIEGSSLRKESRFATS